MLVELTRCQKELRQSVKCSTESTETDVQNQFKIERLFRSTVSKSYKMKNGRTVDPKPKSGQIRYKPLAKKRTRSSQKISVK